MIQVQTDPEDRKATQAACHTPDQYTPGRPDRQSPDMRSRATRAVRRLFPASSERVSRTIYYLKQGGDVYRRPATSSFSDAGPALIRRMPVTRLDSHLPRHKTHPIPIRRSRLASRLRLFWLNIVLIPIRFQHMLRYIFQESFEYH